MALPTLTAEQRQAALAKAAEARKSRSMMLAQLKNGRITLSAVLQRVDDGEEIVRKTRVLATVKALPGIGEVRARQLLEQAEVAENRRLGGLGQKQREALLAAIS
ncbi:integration host factor, actinobacterial type [Amycolatopsis sp. cmx-4-61]|uniref:integration host factor, actinobacterial type n=1 Tax=Amycolatopsis sp. cmx-4-61 TaxID=2790937 RepID=UPI00397B5B43